MNASTALLMVAKTKFEPFSASDFDAFSGVNSDNPMIGEYKDYLIIIDGEVIEITDQMGDGHCYSFILGAPLQIY